MNIELLKRILVEKGIYKKETAGGRNIIAKCVICGDHPNERKQNHLYIATDKNVYHCFLNGCSGRTSSLLRKLTGTTENINDIFTRDELNTKVVSHIGGIIKKGKLVRNLKQFEIPQIEPDQFLNKRKYIKERLNFLTNPEDTPGLIFDIRGFIHNNKIEFNSDLHNLDFLHNNYIAFLMNHQTMLWCRCLIDDTPMKFAKIHLQDDVLELLDYYSFPGGGGKDSTTVVIGEGIFNCLAEYNTDSLGIRDTVHSYVACQGFDNFSGVIKSFCFDNHMFEIDLVVLSDTDKEIDKYLKLLDKTDHNLKSLNIYYNKSGKDFGTFPLVPVKGGNLRDVEKYRKDKKTFSRNTYKRNFS